MNSRRFSQVCVAFIAVGFLAALVIASQRWRIEAGNRSVEVVVDYEEAVLLAQEKGLDVGRCLRALKDAGVTSIAVQEVTLETLLADGTIRLQPSSRLGQTSFVLQRRTSALAALLPYLQSKIQGARLTGGGPSGFGSLIMPTPGETVLKTGLGLPPEALKAVRGAGLLPIARPANDPLVSGEYIRRLFSDLSRARVTKVVFDGKSVMGFPGLLEETAHDLRDLGLNYCWVEFAEQQGGEKLAKLLGYRLMRLHSVSAEEILRMKPAEALDRLLRAAKERSIRLLYVHLPPAHSSDPEAEPVEFVGALARSLSQSGFRLEEAKVLPEYSPHFIWLFLLVLGICASPFLLLNVWSMGNPRVLAMAMAGVIVAALGLIAAGQGLARPLLAFLAGVMFPILSLSVLFPSSAATEVPTLRAAIKDGLIRVVGCVAISLVGGLLVAGILSKSSYFVGGQLFRGIKLAQALPLAVVFFLVIGKVESGGILKPDEGKIRQFMGLNIQVKHLIGLVFLLLIAAIWITRTGNQPGVGTLPLEMKFRALLDSALGVRPRTKEFLFGHPLLLLGFVAYVLGGSGWRPWALVLVLVGTIGQVSVVNTFCHLHSPLYLGLWRTFNGLWLGCLLGVILALVVFARRWMRLNREA